MPADASTRDLVAFLSRNIRAVKVALVLSYREDDLHRRHPLRPLLAELARNVAVETIQLGPMTRSELTVLLAGVDGAVPADGVVDAVMSRSRSNHEIAKELFISEKTASVHVTHLPRKLGVAGRIEAAAVAQRIGMGPAGRSSRAARRRRNPESRRRPRC